MLSAFEAQAVHELKQRDKSKVECLLAYGDRLLVGLNTGSLRVFRVNDVSDASKPVELLSEFEKFSRKPVQQLAIVREANLLVSLSDAAVSLHDLQSFELVETLERTKGAVCFAVTSNVVKDADTKVPSLVSRLAVGCKRKVLSWTWQDMELLEDVAEINVEASVKSLNWADGTRLIAGMDPGFSVLDITTQEMTYVNKPALKTSSTTDLSTGELVGNRFGAVSSSGMGYMGMGSWVPKPMAAPLSDNTVLLAKDVNTLFVTNDGKPLEKRQVPWAFAPEAIGYSYPYLLALNPPEKGSLQIRNPDTLSLLQNINVPGATIIHVPQPNISLAHAGKGFLVASDRVIWRMNALPYDSQLVSMVEKQRFDEAVSLLNLLEDTLIDDKAGRIREIMTLKGVHMFHLQQYRPALSLFTQAETAPDRVIALYPRSIAGDLSGLPEDRSELEPQEGNELRNDDAAKESPATPSRGILGISRSKAKKLDSDSASMKSPARGDPDSMSIRSKTAKVPDKPLEGDDLKTAVRELCSFLADARKPLQKSLHPDGTLKENPPSLDSETGKPLFSNLLPQSVVSPDTNNVNWQTELLEVAKIVDTTLFRSYMLTVPQLVGSLFRIDNFCDPEVVQAALYESQRYNDLIDFLHGKKLHRQALEMLAKFGKGEADGEVPDGMQGPQRTVAYLKQLPPGLVDIVLEFARWPMETNPVIGMEVFLADSDNAEKLPRGRVLDFLRDINEKHELKYLEHIISELGDDTEGFHQRLVDLYLTELELHPGDEEKRAYLKSKLEAFLNQSRMYNRSMTLKKLPIDDPVFYEARAIVLGALREHKQVLEIYVYRLQDYYKAENYCSRVYIEEQSNQDAPLSLSTNRREKPPRTTELQETAAKPDIFAVLLGLYLRPSSGREKRWPQALELLSKHGARLPASSTLEMMPDDLAVRELQDYFRGRIRNATSKLREDLLVKNLESVRQANTERALLLGLDYDDNDDDAFEPEKQKPGGRNRRVRIGEEDHCRVCNTRFRANAVRVFPDNRVIHYGCVGRMASTAAVGGGGVSGRAMPAQVMRRPPSSAGWG